MATGGDRDWHGAPSHQKHVTDFHQNYAKFPKEAIASAQVHLGQTLETLRPHLKDSGMAEHIEYGGGSYERIKVSSTPLEFDVMARIPEGKHITVNPTQPLFADLVSTSETHAKFTDPGTNVIQPQKVVDAFQSSLQRALNSEPELQTVKLVKHGPAIQLDVYKTPAQKELFYSVDMVPSFQCDNGYYVAKPFKGEHQGGAETSSTSFRKSYSLEEKARIQTLDVGNKCHKQVMRNLKVRRDLEPGLHNVNSYMIKTAMLNLDRDKTLDWSQKNMGQREIDTMKYLGDALQNNDLPHHFEPKVNLLDGISSVNRANMGDRLKELVRSEKKCHQESKPKGPGKCQPRKSKGCKSKSK